MSPSEFLLRWNEGPVQWGFVRRWIPARTDRYSWGRVLAFAVFITGLFTVLSVSLFLILGGTGMVPWVALTAAELGACVGLSISLLSRLCWNRRAARLAADPNGPEATVPWPRLGHLRQTGLGLLYGMTIAYLIPLLLFYAIENARGAWAWRQLRAELKAKGECYELPCVIPPPALDEDNFFGTPFWQQFAYRTEKLPNGESSNIWLHGSGLDYSTNYFTLSEPPEPTRRGAGFSKDPTDGRVNLAVWAAHLRFVTNDARKANHILFPLPPPRGEPAADVLLALGKFDATLAEFASATSRQRNRYPVHYEDGSEALLPHLTALRYFARICRLRAVARLGAGDTEGAAADTLLAYRLGESLNEDPFVISQLVRIAMDGFTHHALWEGLVAHRWTEAQLLAFQQRLSRLDYADTMVRTLEGERALGNHFAEGMISDRSQPLVRYETFDPSQNRDRPGSGVIAAGYVIPTGWLRQSQVGLLRGYELILEQARTAMAATNRAAILVANRQGEDIVDHYVQRISESGPPFNFLVKFHLLGISKATEKADRAQTLAQMAIIACALERHRLAHGTYPATLSELTPAYLTTLPADWMSGESFHYLRTEDGWFRLWSVGPNGKDDAGIYREDTKDPLVQDLDWPWPSPVPTREPRMF